MSTTPQFLKVLPDDIARVGPAGACILALVRYVTSLPGETNGRRIADGAMWWRASHTDIGQSLGGLTRYVVRREMEKLQRSGDLLSIPAEDFYGDRAQAYRTPGKPSRDGASGNDQPLCDSAPGSDQPLCDSAPPIVRNRTSTWCESAPARGANPHIPSISGELEEEGRSARSDPAEPLDAAAVPQACNAPSPKPSRTCPKHDADFEGNCRACGKARRDFEEWEADGPARIADENARLAKIRRDCMHCDDNGFVLDPVTLDPIGRCAEHERAVA